MPIWVFCARTGNFEQGLACVRVSLQALAFQTKKGARLIYVPLAAFLVRSQAHLHRVKERLQVYCPGVSWVRKSCAVWVFRSNAQSGARPLVCVCARRQPRRTEYKGNSTKSKMGGGRFWFRSSLLDGRIRNHGLPLKPITALGFTRCLYRRNSSTHWRISCGRQAKTKTDDTQSMAKL